MNTPPQTRSGRMVAPPAQRGAPSEPVTHADLRVLHEVVADLADVLSSGQFRTDLREGVLLDVTIRNVRCLLVEQEPPFQVALSPRERQIALMVAHGRTNQAIATSLDISVWTVSTHLRRIFAKLAVANRAEMVARLFADHDYSPLVAPTDLHHRD